MSASLVIELIRPHELGAEERALWNSFRTASPRYASPYFDLRYTLVAGGCAPEPRVAIIHRAGRIVGFLPFQKRGRTILPIGAPMTDFHGLIARPGEEIELRSVVAALGAGSYRFTGLTSGGVAGARGVVQHHTMVADLSDGFEAYMERQQTRHPRFFKSRRRNTRAAERELGAIEFTWSRRDTGVADYIIGLKRDQYRRTGQHDIFACGWTEEMVRTIGQSEDPDFGLGFATLRAGGWLASAEIGLLSGGVYHLWLPVYEPAFGRYGPGMMMTLKTLQALAGVGVRRVDFGRNDAEYKGYLADPHEIVHEGFAAPAAALSALADRTLSMAGPLQKLGDLRTRARRRLDVITACETNAWGWACGAALAVGLLTHGLAPLIRTPVQSPRRPDVQRTYSRLVGAPEERISAPSDDVRASAA
jgi:CelD/BcsL family acetyltransferase involved in cellulose biosynthesis